MKHYFTFINLMTRVWYNIFGRGSASTAPHVEARTGGGGGGGGESGQFRFQLLEAD